MKRFSLIVLMLFTITAFAQDKDQSNIIKMITAPGAYDDGFNLGMQYEHTNNTILVGGELLASPWLNHSKQPKETPYYHLIGRFGLNHYFDWGVQEFLRIYSGGRAGFIFRNDAGTIRGYQLLGLEAGFEFILWDQFLFGGSVTSDLKNDSNMYSNDDSHTVNSVFISVGVRF